MLNLWITFAPLQPHWVLPKGVNLPYHFTEQVSLRKIPEWIWQDTTGDELRPQLRENVDAGCHHCIAVEYKADSPDMSDINWEGDPPWSIQDTAAQLARSAHLALWLARPTVLSFGIVAEVAREDSGWVTRKITPYSAVCALPESRHEEHTLEDLATARALFQALQTVSFNGPVRTAALVIMKALLDQTWEFRFLLMWLVTECLFGPEDSREISFRISQRVALFLETDQAKAHDLFAQVKDSYAWRSKVVHGLRLAKLKEEKSHTLLQDLERLVRRSLVAILASESFLEIFDGKRREEYLDSLAFR